MRLPISYGHTKNLFKIIFVVSLKKKICQAEIFRANDAITLTSSPFYTYRAFPDVGINIDIKNCDPRLVAAVDELIRKYGREDREEIKVTFVS